MDYAGCVAGDHSLHNLDRWIYQDILTYYFDCPKIKSLEKKWFSYRNYLLKTNLSEKVSRQLLLEHSLLCDKVEKVFARVGPLHDDDEAVDPLEIVYEPHHPWAAA